MLPAPARDDIARFNAQLDRQAPSPRYRTLDLWERLWNGEQYSDRPGFWTRDIPLRMRAPVVVYPIAKTAGQRLIAFVFGEDRFPAVAIDRDAMADYLISDDEAQTLDSFVSQVVKRARVRQTMRQWTKAGLSCGTGVVLGTLNNGRLGLEVVPAKWCTPTRNRRTGALERLEIRYDYAVTERQENGALEERWYWYRRVLTSTSDVTFKPAPCASDGSEPPWMPDPELTFVTEFLAAVWVRNMPECEYAGDIDGTPLANGLMDEIEALDFASSQRHRNAQYNAEPQPVAIGVKREGIEAGQGRTASPLTEADRARMFHADMQQPGLSRRGWFGRAADAVKSAFRKAPGEVWTIADPQGDIKMLESSGAGGKLLQDDADALRSMILEALGVVLADPEKIGTGDLSAKALTMMHAPMLAVCDSLRETWGQDGLIPAVCMLLRLACTTAAVEGGLRIPGAARAVPILRARCMGPNGWVDPPIALQWGPYFKPSASEIQSAVSAAKSATGDQPVLSRRTAIEKVLPMVVENVDAEIDAIDRESGAHMDGMRKLLDASAKTGPADTGADDAVTPEPTTPDVQKTAMNGAQVQTLIETIEKVAAGTLPRDAAINALALAFQITLQEADRILASAGRGFVPAAPESETPTPEAVP